MGGIYDFPSCGTCNMLRSLTGKPPAPPHTHLLTATQKWGLGIPAELEQEECGVQLPTVGGHGGSLSPPS